MSDSLTITADEIGRLLQPDLKHPGAWFRRHAGELTSRHGFPGKLPGAAVWSRLTVTAWIATYGLPATTRTAVTGNLVTEQQKAILAAFGRAA